MRTLRPAITGLAAAAVSAAALTAAGTAAAAPTVSVVARGLNAPRHLTIGPDGDLYVAVAGVGGGRHASCEAGLGVRGTPTRFCAGDSSAVDRISRRGTITPQLELLPSVRETDTGEVTGMDAIAFHGRSAVALMGSVQSDAVGQAPFGQIEGGSGAFSYLADVVKGPTKTGMQQSSGVSIGSFAATHPQAAQALGGLPGETRYDSDPHDVVAYRGGWAVADAGANDLVLATLRRNHRGRVSLLARFPAEPETAPAGVLGSTPTTVDAQAVPSSVTVGPDGALYVGVLRGIPGLPGSATVYRVVPGQPPVAVVTGLTRVSDLAFTGSGRLLILESNTGGALAPIDAGGALLVATPNAAAPVTATDLQVPGLVDPTGLTVDSAGHAYITNRSTGAHRGEIVKVSGLGQG